jgi:diguanylate cyclase (GGDEF)-like protein/PAS domain S-box-containing protein
MIPSCAISVLIVEDELIVALNLSKELEGLGYIIAGMASSETEAIELAQQNSPDVILMDINLESGGSGLTAAKQIRKYSQVPIIFVTAYSSDKIIDLIGSTNPYGYILKPYNIREVKAVISTALIRRDYEKQIVRSQQRLKVAMQAADLGVIEFKPDRQVIELEHHSRKLQSLGFSEKMERQAFLKLFSPLDAALINKLLDKGKAFNRRARVNDTSKGPHSYVDIYLTQVMLEKEHVLIGAVQDVSSAQNNINLMQISDSILHQMQESVLVLNSDEVIQQVNPAFCEMVGTDRSDIIQQPFNKFLLLERQDDEPLSSINGATEGLANKNRKRVTIKRSKGQHLHAIMTVSNYLSDGYNKQVIVTLTDVSQLVEAEQSLSKMAYTDSLTGFGNRAYLNDLLTQLKSERNKGSIALLFIDIDSFKHINDSLGHHAGDSVLKTFADRLKQVFRNKDYLVRLGGDEFVVILMGNLNADSLSTLANKVLHLFTEDFDASGKRLSASCSLGVAYSTFEAFDPQHLLKQADAAMYHAKARGKNTYQFYDKSFDDQTQYRISLEQSLKAAIKNQELTIYLQPIVDSNGVVQSAEALCRWYDKKAGFIPPDEFIAIAEESYLIQSLGLAVIHEAMLAKIQLNSAGFENIVININFSEKQLLNDDAVSLMTEILQQYELNANEFVIEITESTLQSSDSEQNIAQLKALGFKFAIDDFGTGYSSLSRLHNYNVDILKIDRLFTQLVTEDSRQNIITQAIIELGKHLDYKIVVEGVETPEQLKVLKGMGADSMQGFYFAQPMPVHEFLRFLAK